MGIFDRLKGRQIRDPLKNEAYFRKYIQQQEKRIDHFTNMMEQVPKERVPLVEMFLSDMKYSLFTAKYSMGADPNDLSKEWPEVLCMMAKNWDNTVGLVEIINAVALSLQKLYSQGKQFFPVIYKLYETVLDVITLDWGDLEEKHTPSALSAIERAEQILTEHGIPFPQDQQALNFIMNHRDGHYGKPFDGISLSSVL